MMQWKKTKSKKDDFQAVQIKLNTLDIPALLEDTIWCSQHGTFQKGY